jgi:hypothetical protein
MEAHVSAEVQHGGGPFHTGWIFMIKEDWVAENEQLQVRKNNFDMAACQGSGSTSTSLYSLMMSFGSFFLRTVRLCTQPPQLADLRRPLPY